MRVGSLVLVIVMCVCSLAVLTWAFTSPAPEIGDHEDATHGAVAPGGPESEAYILKYTMNSIDEEPVKLDKYRGKVLLVVNVASKCGLTPQYEQLEALYRENKDKGFEILAFPANNFNGQEPGTNEEIKAFCTGTYDVTFPVFAKISVKGDDTHALYKQLAALPEPLGGEPKWNFTKFLVNRKGEVVARFEPRTKPDDAKVLEKLNELLAEPEPESGSGTGSGS